MIGWMIVAALVVAFVLIPPADINGWSMRGYGRELSSWVAFLVAVAAVVAVVGALIYFAIQLIRGEG